MGRKKKRQDEVDKPWCWYCEREFDEENVLIAHQRAKHFSCHYCSRKLNSASGLLSHLDGVHSQSLDKVPNSVPGRESFQYEIYGMTGLPYGARRSKAVEDDTSDGEQGGTSKRKPAPPPPPGFAQMTSRPHFRPPPSLPSGMFAAPPPPPIPPASFMPPMHLGPALPPPPFLPPGMMPPMPPPPMPLLPLTAQGMPPMPLPPPPPFMFPHMFGRPLPPPPPPHALPLLHPPSASQQSNDLEAIDSKLPPPTDQKISTQGPVLVYNDDTLSMEEKRAKLSKYKTEKIVLIEELRDMRSVVESRMENTQKNE